ncbi:Histidinol dehydrogenase [Candidatus Johnevansia muelleri]|uniref:Histidinol dehydrogenase n=1 Tax=Candidatus Johnevansia muelleri TaxID=1495769 RepID=A0A078KEI3_9GAMM|nr:Histidinol dehydrogenase [Candidatus Evansia muelleri]
MITVIKLSYNDINFYDHLKKILYNENIFDIKKKYVDKIIKKVKISGDIALVELTKKLDNIDVKTMESLIIKRDILKIAYDTLSINQKESLKLAANRIKHYHEHQSKFHISWKYEEAPGILLGQKVTPIDRVGVYVPGGKASYPSSVLMNIIPAIIAGVNEIIMVVPAPNGILNKMVLAAAYIANINYVFTIGGAQAIAALAYGTESVPKVDKIVGPGNIFVTIAKRAVFGQVGIDMLAGPSEILILSDGNTNPDWIAMDILSQCEHDEKAQAIFITWDINHLNAVYASIKKFLLKMNRINIIKKSLSKRGALIKVEDEIQAIELINYIAPEHLELSINNPEKLLNNINHSGSIFMGRYTSEVFGDYCAGPSHVLPTSRTSRFSSPLSIYDFQKRSSILQCSLEGAQYLSKNSSILARSESLIAHAISAEYRI